jgi:transmembrane sensor
MTDTPTRHSAPDADAAPDWEALARYLAGESPAAEARALAEWLAAHPADAAMLRALDAEATRAARPGPVDGSIDVEAALRRVQLRRDAAPAPMSGDPHVLPFRRPVAAPRSAPAAPPAAVASTGIRRRDWRLGGLAAAAAIAALAVGLGRRTGTPDAPAVAAAPARVLQTAVGVRDSLDLPDGSRVVLAPGSRLTVAAGYGDGARDVTLEGAGWFSVRHDAARPFRVRAGGAQVVDLGTEFTVRTDGLPGARGVAVAVHEGSVSLAADTDGTAAARALVLTAGDRGVVDAQGRASAERGAASAEDAAWTRGRLTYRATPLVVVQADLRRWYGIELRLADSALVGRRLTATFDGDPVERVLEVIALAVGGEVTRTGDVAVLRRARGRP